MRNCSKNRTRLPECSPPLRIRTDRSCIAALDPFQSQTPSWCGQPAGRELGRGGGRQGRLGYAAFPAETQRFASPLIVCCQAGPSGGRREDCSRRDVKRSSCSSRLHLFCSISPLSYLMTYFSTPLAGEEMKQIPSRENETFGQQPGSRWKTFSRTWRQLSFTN